MGSKAKKNSMEIKYRLVTAEDIPNVHELVNRVFRRFVEPEYSEEGIREFQTYIQPDAFQTRLRENHFALVGEAQNRIVGVIEIRGYEHVSLLFVDPDFHRRGVAKGLFHRAVDLCLTEKPDLTEITVNSSFYAVMIYGRLGFYRTGEKQIKNGISFVPMVFKVQG